MWKQTVVDFLMRRRWLVLVVLGLITATALFYSSKVRFDSSIEIWFLDNDPNLEAYHDFLDRFEGDEIIVIGVFSDDIFSPEVMASIDRITLAAEETIFVNRVTSITNVRVATGSSEFVSISPLVPELPVTLEESDNIRKRALDIPLLSELVSKDSRATAILIEMSYEGNDFESKVKLTNDLRTVAEKEQKNAKIVLAGTPPLDDAFYRYSERDYRVLAPVSFLMIIVLVFAVFRRFSTVIIPIAVVLMANIWTFGIMGALGIQINVVSTSLFALILAVGIADSIHVLAEYYQQLMNGATPETAISKSFHNLLTPCFFTSVTTAMGMLSLTVSNLGPVREFGFLAAIGVTLAFLLSMIFIPSVLVMVKPPDPKFIERQKTGPLSRILKLLGTPSKGRSIWIVGISLILLGTSFYSVTQIEIGSNPLKYFKKGELIRTSIEEIEEKIGGTASVEYFVQAPDEGLKNPENLNRLDQLQSWIESHNGVTSAISILDSLKEINRTFHDGDKIYSILPDTRILAAQYYILMEGEDDFDAFVQDNYTVGRISARVKMTNSEELIAEVPNIMKKLDRNYNDDELKVEVTGYVKLMSDMETYLLKSQIRSFLLAFIVITISMLLLLRSFKLGLLAMIPNFIPVFIGLGFMSFVGITLDPGTSMIASIVLGLVVDDTVHFLFRLKRNMESKNNISDVIYSSMMDTGRPIIITSIVLCAGFLILTLGSFTPNIYFGLISSMVITLAVIADLVLLPAVLVIFERK